MRHHDVVAPRPSPQFPQGPEGEPGVSQGRNRQPVAVRSWRKGHRIDDRTELPEPLGEVEGEDLCPSPVAVGDQLEDAQRTGQTGRRRVHTLK